MIPAVFAIVHTGNIKETEEKVHWGGKTTTCFDNNNNNNNNNNNKGSYMALNFDWHKHPQALLTFHSILFFFFFSSLKLVFDWFYLLIFISLLFCATSMLCMELFWRVISGQSSSSSSWSSSSWSSSSSSGMQCPLEWCHMGTSPSVILNLFSVTKFVLRMSAPWWSLSCTLYSSHARWSYRRRLGSLLLWACSMCDVNSSSANYFPLFVDSWFT